MPIEQCTKDRWEKIRDMTREYPNVTAVAFYEKYTALMKHPTAQLTGNGVLYYRTIRNRDSFNRVFLIWQGEDPEIMQGALSELRFCFDHLPTCSFVVLRGALYHE